MKLCLAAWSLSFEAAHALVLALGHSRLDYCNAVLASALQSQLALLQFILCSAARIVLRCSHRAGLTQLIRERIHWLPVPERMRYKLAALTYKCISGSGSRLSDEYMHWSPVIRSLVSSSLCNCRRLLLPTTDTVTVGQGGF